MIIKLIYKQDFDSDRIQNVTLFCLKITSAPFYVRLRGQNKQSKPLDMWVSYLCSYFPGNAHEKLFHQSFARPLSFLLLKFTGWVHVYF